MSKLPPDEHAIRALMDQADADGDLERVAICERALGATRRDLRITGHFEHLPTEFRSRRGIERAAAECAKIIAAATEERL